MSKDRGETRDDNDDTCDNSATAPVENDALGLLSAATLMKSNRSESSLSVLDEIDTWFAREDIHTNIREGVSSPPPAASINVPSVGQSSSSFTHDNIAGSCSGSNGGSNEKKKMFAAFRSRRSLSHLAKSKTTTSAAAASSSLLDDYSMSNDNSPVPNPLAKSNPNPLAKSNNRQQQQTLVHNPIFDSLSVPNPILVVVDQEQTQDSVVTTERDNSIVGAQQPMMPSSSVTTGKGGVGEGISTPAVENEGDRELSTTATALIVPNPLLIPHEELRPIHTCAETSFVEPSSSNNKNKNKGTPSSVQPSTTALYEVVDRLFAEANKNTVTVKDIVQSVGNYFHLLKVHKSMKKLIKARLTDLMVQSKVVIQYQNDNESSNLQNKIVVDVGREELIEQSLTNCTTGVDGCGVDDRNSSSSSSSDLGTSKEDTELTITPVTLPAISAATRKSRWGPRVISIINGNDSNQPNYNIDTNTTPANKDISCISEINNHIDRDEVDHDKNNKNSNKEKNDNTNVAKYKHRPSSFKNADEALCALTRIREARAAARVVVDLSQEDDSTTIDESRSVVAMSAEKNGNNNNDDGGDDNDQGAIDDALTLWLGTDSFPNDDVDYHVGGDDSLQESTVMLQSNRSQEEETDGNNKSTTAAEYDIESHTMNAQDMDVYFAKVAATTNPSEKDDLASVATESTGISGGTAIDSLMAMSPPLFIDGDEFDSPLKFNDDLHIEEIEAMSLEPSSENVPEKNGTESRSQENESVTMKPSTKSPEEGEANTLESSSKLTEESERNISESGSKVPEVSEASTSESSTKMSEESEGNTSESSSKLPEESEANSFELSRKIPGVSEASMSDSSNKMPEESDANTFESIGEISDAIEISESRHPESIGAMDNSLSVGVTSAVEFNEGVNDKNEALKTASFHPSNDNIQRIAMTSFDPSRNEEMNVDEEIDEEQIRDFCMMLDRLGSLPDEVAINNLSMVADDFSSSVESASTIYFSIHDLLVDRTSPGISNPDRKLPLVYVIDSLLKNVKGVYSDIICDDAANWMSTVYDIFDKAKMDDETARLREIWNTWRELDLIKDEAKWREIGKCFLEAKGLSKTRARTEDKVNVGDAAEWNETPTNAKSNDVQSGDDVAFSDVFVTQVEEVMIPQTSKPPKKLSRPPKNPSSMKRDIGCRTDERNETWKNAVVPAAGADCDDDIPLDLRKQKKNNDGGADAVEEMNCASPRSAARPTRKKRGKVLKIPSSSKEVVGNEVNKSVPVHKKTAPSVEESGIENDSPPEKPAQTSEDDDKAVDAADETVPLAPIPPTKRLVRPPKKPSTKVVAKAGKQDETPKDASVSATEDVFDNDIRLQQRSQVKSVDKNIAFVKETVLSPPKPASKPIQKKRSKASKKLSSEEVVGSKINTRAVVQKRTALPMKEINIDNDSPPEQHVQVSNDVVAVNALDEEISPALTQVEEVMNPQTSKIPPKKRGRSKKPSFNDKNARIRAGEQSETRKIAAFPVAGEDFDDDIPLDQLKQKFNSNGEADAIKKTIRASPKLPTKRSGRQSKKLTPRGEVDRDEVNKEDMASRGREVVIASNEERGGETSVAYIAKSDRRSCEESPTSVGGKGVITLSKSDQCAGTLKLGVTAMSATTTMTTPVTSAIIRLARVTVVTDVEIAVSPNKIYTLHAMIKKENAAILIQRTTRGIFGRNIYRRMEKELWAAILVQRAVRGHSGRCTSYQKRMERGAQINIARMMRGLFARRRFLDVCKKRECAATKIECLWRIHAAIVLRSAHRRQMEASTTIQKSAARAGRCTVVTDVEIAERPARQPRLNGNPTLPETINVPLAVANETEMPSGRPQKIPVHLSTNEAVDVSFVSAPIDAISHRMPEEMVDKDKNHHSTKRVRDDTQELATSLSESLHGKRARRESGEPSSQNYGTGSDRLLVFPATASRPQLQVSASLSNRMSSRNLVIVTREKIEVGMSSVFETAFARARRATSEDNKDYYILGELKDELNKELDSVAAGRDASLPSSLRGGSDMILNGLSEDDFSQKQIDSCPVIFAHNAEDPDGSSEESATIATLDHEIGQQRLKQRFTNLLEGMKRKRSSMGHTTLDEKELQLPVEEFPTGWVVTQRPREAQTKGGVPRVDLFWYSPKMKYRFRSRVEVRRFLEFLDLTCGDETAAMEKFKK